MKSKVLIAESNSPLADLWRAYLARAGFDVKCFVPGHGSPQDFSDWGLPHIVVSGIEVEGAIPSGEELCLQLLARKPDSKCMIPLIQLYSAQLSDAHGSPFKMIRKPVALPALLEAVRKAHVRSLAFILQQSGSPVATAELSPTSLHGMLLSVMTDSLSGMILAESQTGAAFLSFRNGSLLDAECGHLSGEEAALEMLSWTSGEASFYHGDHELLPEGRDCLPGIKALLSESRRQHEGIAGLQRTVSDSCGMLYRNPAIRLSGTALFSEQLYIALEVPSDIESLLGRLHNLTRRQALSSLAGMLERGEVICTASREASKSMPIRTCRQFLEAISSLDAYPSPIVISTPPSIGVFSATPSFGKRFIGTLAGSNLSHSVMLTSSKQSLFIYDLCPDCRQGLDRQSAAILIFDGTDANALKPSLRFLEQLKEAGISSLCIAIPPQNAMPSSQSHVSETLNLKDTDIKVIHFEWSFQSAISVLSALLTGTLEKDS